MNKELNKDKLFINRVDIYGETEIQPVSKKQKVEAAKKQWIHKRGQKSWRTYGHNVRFFTVLLTDLNCSCMRFKFAVLSRVAGPDFLFFKPKIRISFFHRNFCVFGCAYPSKPNKDKKNISFSGTNNDISREKKSKQGIWNV